MKPLRLTGHAHAVVAERGLQVNWIEQAARSPEWVAEDETTAGAERRFLTIPEAGHRILRVVCVETDVEIRVVTVFFDRNAKRPA